MLTDTIELPKPDNGSILVGREEVCLGHSDKAMREYASKVSLENCFGLLSLLYDIRKAAGDPTGKLMQAELVAHIAALRADAGRWDRVRNPKGDGPCPLLWMTDEDCITIGDPLTGTDADAAIDAARAAK